MAEKILYNDAGTLREITTIIAQPGLPIDRVYRVRRMVDPMDLMSYIQEYDLVWTRNNYDPPTVAVPNVSISRDTALLGPSVYTVNWNTTGGAPETFYDVSVRWWVDSGSGFSLEDIDGAPQGDAALSRTYDAQDDVYAVVDYSNPAGSGPDTTTATI